MDIWYLILIVIIPLLIVLMFLTFKYMFLSKHIKKPKHIRNEQIEIIKRHKNNEFTDFELNIIKKVCTEEFYPYYFFYCQSEFIWNDLYSKLSQDEKIFYSCTCEISLYKNEQLSHYSPVQVFYTNKYNIYLYNYENISKPKQKVINKGIPGEFVYKLSTDIIAKFEYDIDLKLINKGDNGIYAVACLDLSDNHKLILDKIYARSIEIIIEMYNNYNQFNYFDYTSKELNMKCLQRQFDKCNDLHQKGLINSETLSTITRKADKTFQESNNSLVRERMNDL